MDRLRGYRRPVSAATLAQILGVSQRTLYRDIASLQAMGVPVRGEAGIGYILEPGFFLPPLMFTRDELEALALGADYVSSRADPGLAAAARSALSRIAAILSVSSRDQLEAAALMVGPPGAIPSCGLDATALRRAIQDEAVLDLSYCDAQGQRTERTIWPLAIAYFDNADILVGWCVLRGQFRHFRLDRILDLRPHGQRMPRRRAVLLRQWERWRVTRDMQPTDRN